MAGAVGMRRRKRRYTRCRARVDTAVRTRRGISVLGGVSVEADLLWLPEESPEEKGADNFEEESFCGFLVSEAEVIGEAGACPSFEKAEPIAWCAMSIQGEDASIGTCRISVRGFRCGLSGLRKRLG